MNAAVQNMGIRSLKETLETDLKVMATNPDVAIASLREAAKAIASAHKETLDGVPMVFHHPGLGGPALRIEFKNHRTVWVEVPTHFLT
jgi:hypothetical protein